MFKSRYITSSLFIISSALGCSPTINIPSIVDNTAGSGGEAVGGADSSGGSKAKGGSTNKAGSSAKGGSGGRTNTSNSTGGTENNTGGTTGIGGTSTDTSTTSSSNSGGSNTTGGTVSTGGSTVGGTTSAGGASAKAGSSSSGGTTVTVPAPTISSLSVDFSSVCSGNTATINAVFANGSGSLDNGIGTVSSGVGKVTPPIANDTTYKLSVTNTAGVSVSTTVTVRALANGQFTPTGNMLFPRTWHTATTLTNGQVLVVGGTTGSGGFDTAELYDLTSNTFIAGKSPNVIRSGHTATLLANGRVLLAGITALGSDGRAEVFDPSTGTFTLTSSPLNQARSEGTATRLNNNLVLIAGGRYDSDYGRNSMELFNANSGSNGGFSLVTQTMSASRVSHTANLLPSGKVLLSGGCVDLADDPCVTTNRADLYDPTTGSTGSITATGNLLTGRHMHKSVLLQNGKVLIVGGVDNSGTRLASAELYDPSTGTNGTFTNTGSMASARYAHEVALLKNGKVLVAGGGSATSALLSAEIYDPVTGNFVGTGAMHSTHVRPAIANLPNGMVLITGGGTNTAELYCP